MLPFNVLTSGGLIPQSFVLGKGSLLIKRNVRVALSSILPPEQPRYHETQGDIQGTLENPKLFHHLEEAKVKKEKKTKCSKTLLLNQKRSRKNGSHLRGANPRDARSLFVSSTDNWSFPPPPPPDFEPEPDFRSLSRRSRDLDRSRSRDLRRSRSRCDLEGRSRSRLRERSLRSKKI